MAKCFAIALSRAIAHLQSQTGVESYFEHSDFALTCKPSLPLLDYVARLEQHMRFDEHTLVIAAVLISRLEAKINCPILSSRTAHKVVATAIVIARKLHEDRTMKNQISCQVAGLPLLELNVLEAEFVAKLGFDLFVNGDEYSACRTALLEMMK
eukprot:c8700_g1_i2.p1 GENE.c8700_g1_i2~~c8700_g1_i2.p1  ORF type:complete len:176 (+),score=44.59 c8700_g1_i2:67-528(+)